MFFTAKINENNVFHCRKHCRHAMKVSLHFLENKCHKSGIDLWFSPLASGNHIGLAIDWRLKVRPNFRAQISANNRGIDKQLLFQTSGYLLLQSASKYKQKVSQGTESSRLASSKLSNGDVCGAVRIQASDATYVTLDRFTFENLLSFFGKKEKTGEL